MTPPASDPAVPRASRRVAAPPADWARQLADAEQFALHGRLAAAAVHEISNLMTIVLFNAALLRDHRRADPLVQRHVEPLLQAGNRVAQLCGQLRDKAHAGPPEPRVLELTGLLAGNGQLLERIIGRRVILDLPGDDPLPVFADPGQIDQILLNLVFNARDATTETGVITVRAGRAPAPAGWRFFEVEDNGSGMSPEMRNRVFTEFLTTKPRGAGTGLGLAMVQRLVRELGGRLQLDSEPGRGTCVRILLPVPPGA